MFHNVPDWHLQGSGCYNQHSGALTGSGPTDTLDGVVDTTVSTVAHPRCQDWLTHLMRGGQYSRHGGVPTGLALTDTLGEQYRHALRSKTVWRGRSREEKDNSTLPVLMFPVLGKMHVPRDGWDGCVGGAHTCHQWRQGGDTLPRRFSSGRCPIALTRCLMNNSYLHLTNLWLEDLWVWWGFLQSAYCWLLVVPLHARKGKTERKLSASQGHYSHSQGSSLEAQLILARSPVPKAWHSHSITQVCVAHFMIRTLKYMDIKSIT